MHSENPFKVVILFLAHNGVTQPEWWNKWKNYYEHPEDIIFKVHSPKDPKFGTEFCNMNSIGFYDSNTAWCQPSLVTVYLECLKAVILDYPNSMVYLVSGHDIPIRPARYMFISKYDTIDGDLLPINPKQSKICVPPDFSFMQQWIVLNSKDADLVYDSCYNRYFLSDTAINWYVQEGGCPDEHFLVAALKNGNNMSLKCITYGPHPTVGYSSPREWDFDISTKLSVTAFTDRSKCVDISLELLMYYIRIVSNTHYFVRKIGKDVDLTPLESILQDDTKTSYAKFKEYYEKCYDIKYNTGDYMSKVPKIPCPPLSEFPNRGEVWKLVENPYTEYLKNNKRAISITNSEKLSKDVNVFLESLKIYEEKEVEHVKEYSLKRFTEILNIFRRKKYSDRRNLFINHPSITLPFISDSIFFLEKKLQRNINFNDFIRVLIDYDMNNPNPPKYLVFKKFMDVLKYSYKDQLKINIKNVILIENLQGILQYAKDINNYYYETLLEYFDIEESTGQHVDNDLYTDGKRIRSRIRKSKRKSKNNSRSNRRKRKSRK